MNTYTFFKIIRTLVFFVSVLFFTGNSQAQTDKLKTNISVKDNNLKVEWLMADKYFISRPVEKGDMWGTQIRNNGNDNQGSMALMTSGVIRIDIRPDGNIGVGTSEPRSKFHVVGDFQSQLFDNLRIGTYANDKQGFFGTLTKSDFLLGANECPSMVFDKDNKYVAIFLDKIQPNISEGNKNNYGLFVSKGILTEKYAVAPQNTWADYVFKPGFQLPKLSVIEDFIKTKGHLPNIPSLQSIQSEGYELHDLNVRFLEKIEQLTLYVIEQQKRITQLEVEVQNFKKKTIR